MKKSIFQGNCLSLLVVVLMTFWSAIGITSCTPDYDLDKKVPDWLGPSIYDYLVDNHYDTYVKLIEDLGYKDVLSKTGSKTLFIADEEAVKRFYQSGTFKKLDGSPVNSYEDLSIGQKKMILYGSMLNNVYQVAMLSSSEGSSNSERPVIGDCMRRLSSASQFDNVPYMDTASMPHTKYFKYYYATKKKGIRVLRDASVKPTVFMINKFLVNHKIVDDDYDFLFNQGNYDRTGNKPQHHTAAEASVNGVNIEQQNIKCLNGFIHKVGEVVYTLPNMAECLENDNNTRIYSSLLSRFCAPYFAGVDMTINFDTYVKNNNLDTITDGHGNLLYPQLYGSADSLFELRYFSVTTRNNPNSGQRTAPDGKNVSDMLLKFDPGWNGYYVQTTGTSANVALQQNMSVMLVPTDQALENWWNHGEGYPLKERYGSKNSVSGVDEVIKDMSNIPDYVILKLIKNNMLNSFVSSVPSKFADVLNDAQDPMGLKTTDIDSVKICCNGAVYFTNVVMSPTAYRSVSFPTLVNENLKIINWAVGDWDGKNETGCGYFAYLNSMSSKYSFFVPTVCDKNAPLKARGRLVYIDPVSFGSTTTQAFVFYYDEARKAVTAEIYACDAKGKIDWTKDPIGTATDGSNNTSDQIKNRLVDLLDYHIVIGMVDTDPTYKYFQTKGRGTVKFEIVGGDTLVSGGYQVEQDTVAKVIQAYDMSTNGNGKTYVIDQPLLTSKKSVFDILNDSVNYKEFREFGRLINFAGLYKAPVSAEFGSKFNISVFNTYHYTVYVPSNESIIGLINNHIIISDSIKQILQDGFEDAKANAAISDENKNAILSRMINGGTNPGFTTYAAALASLSSTPATANEKTFNYTKYIDSMVVVTSNFVKFHIQDNSIYIGGKHDSKEYGTAYMNPKTKIFERLNVVSTPTSIQIKDKNNNIRTVKTDNPKLYNIMCREYEYKLSSGKANMLETSSYAVIHYIDGPLCNGQVNF